MAKADPEQRLPGLQHLPGSPAPHIPPSPPDRPARSRGRSRRARSAMISSKLRPRRHHRHPRPGLDQIAEDVALGAIIDRDDVGRASSLRSGRTDLRAPFPSPFVSSEVETPSPIPLPQSHLPPLQRSTCSRLTSLARSMPSSPGQSAASSLQRLEIELAVRAMGDGDRRRPFAAHQPGQRARIDPRNPDPPRSPPSTPAKSCAGAVIARRRSPPRARSRPAHAPRPPRRPRHWRRHCRCGGR